MSKQAQSRSMQSTRGAGSAQGAQAAHIDGSSSHKVEVLRLMDVRVEAIWSSILFLSASSIATIVPWSLGLRVHGH